MFTELQYRLLKRIAPGEPNQCSGQVYADKSKLQLLLGEALMAGVEGKTIIDFGCGEGSEALDLASRGAKRVIGIDIREELLDRARQKAARAGLDRVCCFATSASERADVIVSIDAFEHFDDPSGILAIMSPLLKPDGEVWVSFGPTWYHPLGGHLFSVFPWAHLVFSEEALMRWRGTFKTDGARRFGEVAGGLNQMTIRRFERIIDASPFQFASFEAVPIRRLKPIHTRLTREFTTAIIRCRLVKRPILGGGVPLTP